MKKYLYVAYDKDGLPVAVEESAAALAKRIKTTESNIYRMAQRAEKGLGLGRIRRVLIEEEEE